jgi:aspartate/methionine/tyrosine aminotransferase
MTAGISDRATALLALPPAPLASSNPTMAPAAVAAVLDALDRGETHYTDRPGILPLREKVAEILNRRFALGCGAGDVVLTCGATEARFVSVQQLLKPGDKLAAPSCADRIEGAAIVRGARISEDISATKLVYVPASAGPQAIADWLKDAPESCFVLYEIDVPLVSFHPHSIAGFGERVVTIGEIGLEHGLVGARLGYLAAPAGSSAGLRDFKQALTICSTNLSQWAALAVVEDL